MSLNLKMVLEFESKAAKAELEAVSRAVKKLGNETTTAGGKSRTAATGTSALGDAARRSAANLNALTAAEIAAAQGAVGLGQATGAASGGVGRLGGAFVSLGSMAGSAAGSLVGSVLSIFNPVNLLTGAMIGVATATVNWMFSAGEKAKTTEDHIRSVTSAVGEWREESNKSFADLREEFGVLTPEIVAMQREINQLKVAEILREADAAAQSLSTTLSSGMWSEASQIADLLGVGFGAGTDAALLGFQDLMAAVGEASDVSSQLAAVTALREAFSGAVGGIGAMNAEQAAFYQTVLDTEAALRLAAVASGEVASGTDDAATSATALLSKVSSLGAALSAAAGADLSGPFARAFPTANALLGLAQGILATLSIARGEAAATAELEQIAFENSPGGSALISYGGRTPGGTSSQTALANRNRPVNVPGSGSAGAGAGGGAGAARDEADALQELIASLKGEIEALRVQDPIQQEMLKHREALAGATDAERQQVEALIATREREQLLMEGVKARAEFFEDLGNNALEALIVKGESFNDVLKNIAQSLIQAALQATLFGEGPFGSLFGGKSILSGLFGGGGGGGGGLSALFGGGKATGGMIHGPGTGTSDSVLTPTSNGEYVVNARATARNRHLLEAINAGGRIGGFATGGMVGGDSRRASARGGRELPASIYMDLRGVQGDREIEAKIRKGAAQMVEMYDREGLAVSVQCVSGDPKRRG